MSAYRHTQKGSLILWILGSSALFVAGLGALTREGRWPSILVAALVLVIMVLFASLTVEVTDAEVRLAFGPGLVRKRFRVAEVREARIVTNPWYYGLGIHITPHGWLFNIAGSEAVELTFRTGRKVRIGSDEPHRLQAAVRAAMSRTSAASRQPD